MERARAHPSRADTLSGEDAREARDVLLRIEIAEGRVPSDEDLASSPDVALVAAVALLTNEDHAARAARLAQGALDAPKAGPLIHAEALARVDRGAGANDVRATSVGYRHSAGGALQGGSDHRSPAAGAPLAPLSESVLTSLRRAWRAFLMCTLDTDALSKLKDTDAADLDEAEEEKTRRAAKQTAQRLAREGHVEAALQVFPPDDHPWRSRLLRVDVLQNRRAAGSRAGGSPAPLG